MLENVYPYITNDGSTGLYNANFDDIYHSTTGAYTEACEKFCLSANLDFYFNNYMKINVLDICYGIGYNTKSFLHFYLNFLNNKYFKKGKLSNNSIEQIYSDNIIPKIFINSVDTDKELFFLSPFFVTDAKKFPAKQNFPTEKIKHYHENKITKFFDFEKIINYIIIQNLANNYDNFLGNKDLESFLTDIQNKHIIDQNSKTYYQFLETKEIYSKQKPSIISFVHNIYYRNISKHHKIVLNTLNKNIVDIHYNNTDARKFILNDNTKYHLIFLDAFTPNKCPCLWTLDFFKQLYEHLDDNGKILSYSNSALVRNAFLQAGFSVGKIFNEREKRFTGTVATKNKDLIKHELTGDDLSLLKTRAGIVYRDKNLNALNEAIISCHNQEVCESKLMSSSQFVKLKKAGGNV